MPASAASPSAYEKTVTDDVSAHEFDVELFHDGACSLCAREVKMLRGLDTQKRIRFVDIAERGFDASTVGLTQEQLMARIHARLPDGRLIEGVEVFRQLYASVGFARIVSLSRVPGISHALDVGYHLFAKNRLRLTGRCESDACAIPSSTTSYEAQ